jgi:uncharacterized repeat protein (TIGR01451 family)
MIKKILIKLPTVIVGSVLCVGTNPVLADSLTLPNIPGFPSPSFVNNMVLIDDPGNLNDSTGYGGVDHKFRVSATQITVQDWVEFLNDIEDRLGLDAASLGFGPMTNAHSDCTNSWCDSPYRKIGSNWTSIAFNAHGVDLSASETANLPIDWISMNMAARYLNWLATGDIDSGAFTFVNNGQPRGNWRISSFDANYPGARLPLEDELYKAMYRNNTSNTYYNYPLGGNSLSVASSDTTTALHNSGVGGALVDMFGANSSTAMYAQVGQELGNRWGVRDVGGNRHETTLNPNNLTETIIRGAAVFQPGSFSLKTNRSTQDDNYQNIANNYGPYLAQKRFLSIGYRVWSGVSAPSGLVRITKQVTGGTDTQQFTFNLDCDGTLYDVSNIQISNGQVWESDSIPENTSCTVNETTPTAPSGYTYGAAQYSPSQAVTIGDGTTVTVTVTNPLQQATGSLSISKEVTGEPGGFTSPDFDIEIDCSDNAFDQSITLQDGDSQTISNIPAGTTCTISEPTVPLPPSGYLYGTPVVSPSSVTIQSNTTATVTVTNPMAQDCSISPPTITPSCDDSGTPTNPNDDTFTFTINASGVAVGETYSVSAPASAGLSPNPVTGLSYNGVTAALSGPFDIADGAFNITLTDVDDNSCTTTATVTPPATCSNLQVGSLQISKDVTGEPGGFTSPSYSIEVDCSDNAFDQTITLQDGQSQTISNIPEGTMCTITEPSQPAAPAGYSYGSPTVVPSSVTIQGNQAATVTVTNPLSGDCVMNAPTVTPQCYDNGTPDSSDDTFAFRINTTGDFTAATYDIQGAISVFDVPYGVDSGAYGHFLITSGDVTLNLVDVDDTACVQNNIIVPAPAACSTTPSCDVVTNTASVTAMNEVDEDTTNDTDGVTVRADCTTTPQVDLMIAKTASQTDVSSGDTFTYTLTLTNQGSDMATEIEVQDQLPAGVTYVSNTPSQGTYDAATGIWRVGDLADQGQATLTITVTVD